MPTHSRCLKGGGPGSGGVPPWDFTTRRPGPAEAERVAVALAGEPAAEGEAPGTEGRAVAGPEAGAAELGEARGAAKMTTWFPAASW